jgi:hypothetical protein
MTRLFADLRPVTLLAVIPLAACAAAPPSGPTVFAVPRSGQSLSQLQADDLACRNDVQTRTAPPGATQAAANHAAGGAGAGLLTGSAGGASNTDAIAGDAQTQYDVAYAQCMTSKGDVVVDAPPDYNYAYPGGYPGYAYAYPGGYPYYGAYPYFIGTGPFFFGPRFHGGFHHHGFHHDGFHHGGFHRGGFHHEGFHHGGFHHGGFGHRGGHFGH